MEMPNTDYPICHGEAGYARTTRIALGATVMDVAAGLASRAHATPATRPSWTSPRSTLLWTIGNRTVISGAGRPSCAATAQHALRGREDDRSASAVGAPRQGFVKARTATLTRLGSALARDDARALSLP